MDIQIRQISDDAEEIELVRQFLFDQILKVYGIGPNPKFHYDIIDLRDYYVLPKRSTLLIALNGDKIVATAAIRGYDKDYEFFKGIYTKENTASIWRLMVDENSRRQGIARRLVANLEEFAREASYERIYLNTHRYLDGALTFWQSLDYMVTVEEDDYDETIHMVKSLID